MGATLAAPETQAPDAPAPPERGRRRRPTASQGAPGRTELVIGEVVTADADGLVLRLADGASPRLVRARSLVELDAADVGREVAVQFERGDADRPVVLGVLRRPSHGPAAPPASAAPARPPQRLVLEAAEQLVLRCGSASLTLGPHGRVIVRGDHVVSRSTGVNRVNGASVQIN